MSPDAVSGAPVLKYIFGWGSAQNPVGRAHSGGDRR